MIKQDYEDDEVRRAYRALQDDEVPAAVDERVLAAAKAALTKRRMPAWKRWSAPVALAASVIVVVAIVLDPGARKTASLSSLPASAPAPVERKVDAARQQAQGSSAVEREEAPVELRKDQTPLAKSKAEDITVSARRREETLADVPVAITVLPPEVVAEPPPVTAAPPPPPSPAPAQDATEARSDEDYFPVQTQANASPQGENDRRSGAEHATVPSSAASSSPAAMDPSKTQTPATAITGQSRSAARGPTAVEEVRVTSRNAQDARMTRWLQKIHTLQNEGKRARAAREIEKFKQAYPDVDVDEALEALRQDEPRQ